MIGAHPKTIRLANGLASGGHQVTIWLHKHSEESDGIVPPKWLEPQRLLQHRASNVSTALSLEKAIHEAEVIIYSLPAWDPMISSVVPFLVDSQVLLLMPGSVGGAIRVHKMIRSARQDIVVHVGEVASTDMWTDLTFSLDAYQPEETYPVSYCFFPATSNQYVDFIIENLFSTFVLVDDIRMTSMMNFPSVINPVICLILLGSHDRGEGAGQYRFSSPLHIARLLESVDLERCELANRMGIDTVSIPEWHKRSHAHQHYDYISVVEGMAGMEVPDMGIIETTLSDAIISDLSLYSAIGEAFVTKTQTIDAILHIMRTMLGIKGITPVGSDIDRSLVDALIGSKPKSIGLLKRSVRSYIQEMCNQITKDLESGWLYIEAPREIMLAIKEIIYELSDDRISGKNWKEYLSSKRSRRLIAVTRKTEALKVGFQIEKEYDTFAGMIVTGNPSSMKVEPILFYTQKEIRPFTEKLRAELEDYIAKAIEINEAGEDGGHVLIHDP